MKNKILALTILAFTSMNAMAQEEVNVTGKVVDKVGINSKQQYSWEYGSKKYFRKTDLYSQYQSCNQDKG